MLKRMLPNSWWSRGLWIVGTYVIAADLFPVLLLVLVNSVGYLPYSDRPGPGWQMPHLPTVEELRFFVGFASLLLMGTALYGLIFATAGWVLGFCLLPRWGLRVLAAPTAFLASGLMMAAGGWMIAISSMGVYTAAGCGALWGVFVFPRLVPRMSYALPIAARVALPIVMLAGGTYWLVKPMLPDPGLTNGKIETRRNIDSLSQLKGALDSYANLRASRTSPGIPLELSGNYQISEINGCVITLVHTSTVLDRHYDGSKTTTTSSVNLANLSADAKVSETPYGNGWKPSSRWVLSDDLMVGTAAIPTDTVIERFPGRGEVAKSQSQRIEIEFMDPYVAEVIRKMVVNQVTACADLKKP